jgi:hypothetical protein
MKSNDVEVEAAYGSDGIWKMTWHRLPMKIHGVQAQAKSWGLNATKAADGDY